MLFVEPMAGVSPVAALVRSAHRSLDINAYLVTDRTILSAIRADARRGVVVRAVLDRHPYGGRPQGEVAALKTAGAQVRFAPARFRFDHAKYLIVDGRRIEVGSANLTRAAFRSNREYLWISSQPRAVRALRMVFTADWSGIKAGPLPRASLILSPGATRALVRVIAQPGPVCTESEEMGRDRPILAALRQKGTLAMVLLPATLSRGDRSIAQTLAHHGVRVRLVSRPYLHAKLIVGPEAAYIGSENFSWTSLNHNREAGVLLGNPDRRRLFRQCEEDATAASPLLPEPAR